MKYIDAEKLKRQIRFLIDSGYDNLQGNLYHVLSIIDSLQQDQPMPDSTKLIELWHEDKEMLKEKDFRDDPWRLAYNAFLCGFGRGIAVKKQEQPESDLDTEISTWIPAHIKGNADKEMNIVMGWGDTVARHFAEWGAIHLNARKEQTEVELEKVARYVYESWMRGTMDDVRRDMVELGKVLNARKEE